MNTNNNFELEKCLISLKCKRQIFHSEADFQFALAWEIQSLYCDANVRLEYCLSEVPNTHIDIIVFYLGSAIPIEVKYKTAKVSLKSNNEYFNLKNHGAQDLGKYDCLKDIARIECLSNKLSDFSKGYTIWLTNETSYWKPHKRSGTIDEAFSIHDTARKHGCLAWRSHASQGTIKGREKSIDLIGTYDIIWKDYSDLEIKNGIFKYTIVTVKQRAN